MATKSTTIPGIDLPTAKDLKEINTLPMMSTKSAKKSATIRETDNGFIISVYAGTFNEEWVFTSLSKAIKAIIAFLKVQTEDEK